jgi:hypothetical protein
MNLPRFRRAAILSATALLLLPGVGSAHSPVTGSPGWAGKFDQGPSEFTWDSSVSNWLKTPVRNVLLGTWADQTVNNYERIEFDEVAGGNGTILQISTIPPVLGCEDPAWQGCASGGGSFNWDLYVRKGGTGYDWCQAPNPDPDLPCKDVRRVVIHELGHVGGVINHNNQSQDDTVMQTNGAPNQGLDGWNHFAYQRCDAARMQIMYDVASLAGPYADCFDHVANACSNGLCTDLTATPTSTSVCRGDAVSVSGRLDIQPEHYGREWDPNKFHLDNNALANRIVTIERNGSAFGTAGASSASGANWVKSLTNSTVSSTTTYNYTAEFRRSAQSDLMKSGLSGSEVESFSITYVVDPTIC